eukprot:9896163-Lingulodinium_polyedra.AAC.1
MQLGPGGPPERPHGAPPGGPRARPSPSPRGPRSSGLGGGAVAALRRRPRAGLAGARPSSSTGRWSGGPPARP